MLKKHYRLIAEIETSTDKAYAIVDHETNTSRWNGYSMKKDSVLYWIAKSVAKEENGIYIPTWLVAKDELWEHIDKDDFKMFEVEVKTKKTAEEMLQKRVDVFFNGELPDAYIVVRWSNKPNDFEILEIEMYPDMTAEEIRIEEDAYKVEIIRTI